MKEGALPLFRIIGLPKFQKNEAPKIPTGLPKFRFFCRAEKTSCRFQERDYEDVFFQFNIPKLPVYSSYTILKGIAPTNLE